MQSGLLERVAAHMGKPYLSDLRSVSAGELLEHLRTIPTGDYPVEEWAYALTYIFGVPVKLETTEDLQRIFTEIQGSLTKKK